MWSEFARRSSESVSRVSMPSFMPDSDCMVSAVSERHPHHERAMGAIAGRLAARETMVIAAPALVETYSVLTRLPRTWRLSPEQARELIESSFVANRTIVALDGAAYLDLLRAAPVEGVFGGRIYDAVIVACARAANVDTILTFN